MMRGEKGVNFSYNDNQRRHVEKRRRLDEIYNSS